MINTPTIEIRSEGDNYGQFIISPLEHGMGNTLGNALRRMLLSGIEGAAVTSICIHKKDPGSKECPYIEHEFKTIPGVKEDVTDFMLNLRNLYVKMAPEVENGVVTIEKTGKGEVTGDTIVCPEGIEIVNKDCYLCYVSDEDSLFKVTMTVEKGKGYRMPDKQTNVQDEIGVIPMASVFSPILKVAYSVDPCRVGQNTNFERLVLDIETNGTIKAGASLNNACQQLIDMFVLIGEANGGIISVGGEGKDKAVNLDFLEKSVDVLQFSHRTANCLQREGVKTVKELLSYSEQGLLQIKSFGKISLDEVKLKLDELGLSLAI